MRDGDSLIESYISSFQKVLYQRTFPARVVAVSGSRYTFVLPILSASREWAPLLAEGSVASEEAFN